MTFPTDEINKMVNPLQLVKIELWMLQQIFVSMVHFLPKWMETIVGLMFCAWGKRFRLNLDIKKLAIHLKD